MESSFNGSQVKSCWGKELEREGSVEVKRVGVPTSLAFSECKVPCQKKPISSPQAPLVRILVSSLGEPHFDSDTSLQYLSGQQLSLKNKCPMSILYTGLSGILH